MYKRQYSIGYRGEYWRKKEWQFHGTQLNYLIKRFNTPKSQANFYLKSGAGFAVSDYKNLKGHNRLYINNGDLTFTEKSKDVGLDFKGFGTHASFFDYDNDGDLDIVAADYIPKPEQHAFDQFMKKTGIEPTGAVMIEDMARNLQPAAALGMRTVWLNSDLEWATRGADSDYVHYRADDLKGFLAAVAA